MFFPLNLERRSIVATINARRGFVTQQDHGCSVIRRARSRKAYIRHYKAPIQIIQASEELNLPLSLQEGASLAWIYEGIRTV